MSVGCCTAICTNSKFDSPGLSPTSDSPATMHCIHLTSLCREALVSARSTPVERRAGSPRFSSCSSFLKVCGQLIAPPAAEVSGTASCGGERAMSHESRVRKARCPCETRRRLADVGNAEDFSLEQECGNSCACLSEKFSNSYCLDR